MLQSCLFKTSSFGNTQQIGAKKWKVKSILGHSVLPFTLTFCTLISHCLFSHRSASQLQNSVHLMLFVIESWLVCGCVSFCLTHENISVSTVAGVKNMCSSQGCNTLTTKEVPCYHLSAVCSLWSNPCGAGLNTDSLESVWWVTCSSSGTTERLSSPTISDEVSQWHQLNRLQTSQLAVSLQPIFTGVATGSCRNKERAEIKEDRKQTTLRSSGIPQHD